MKTLATFAAAFLVGGLAAASADPAQDERGKADPGRDDPASALCIRNGARVTVETLPNGGHHAVCAFANGSRIDAATYFRNKHRTH